MQSANTLTFSAEKESGTNLSKSLLMWPCDHYLLVGRHVCFRVSARSSLLFILYSVRDEDCLVWLPGRGVKGKVFFLCVSWLPDGWPWRGEWKEKRQVDDRGVRKRERWPALRDRGNICFKTCLHLVRRNVTGGVCQKTPSRTALHGGLSWGCSRPDAGFTSVFE